MNKQFEVRNEFDVMFKNFIEFMKSQDKIKTTEDMHPDLLYTYMRSPDGISEGSHIFFKVPDDFKYIGIDNSKLDCQLNLEFCRFNSETTLVEIYYHKVGFPLTDGWFKEERENTDD